MNLRWNIVIGAICQWKSAVLNPSITSIHCLFNLSTESVNIIDIYMHSLCWSACVCIKWIMSKFSHKVRDIANCNYFLFLFYIEIQRNGKIVKNVIKVFKWFWLVLFGIVRMHVCMSRGTRPFNTLKCTRLKRSTQRQKAYWNSNVEGDVYSVYKHSHNSNTIKMKL